MSESEDYFSMFNSGCWAVEEAGDCLCGGRGWALSEVDTWHKCPVHFCGQLDPQDYDSPMTDDEFEAAEKLSRARWAVKAAARGVEYAERSVLTAKDNLKAAEAALAALAGPPAPEAPKSVLPAETPSPDTDLDDGGDLDIPF